MKNNKLTEEQIEFKVSGRKKLYENAKKNFEHKNLKNDWLNSKFIISFAKKFSIENELQIIAKMFWKETEVEKEIIAFQTLKEIEQIDRQSIKMDQDG